MVIGEAEQACTSSMAVLRVLPEPVHRALALQEAAASFTLDGVEIDLEAFLVAAHQGTVLHTDSLRHLDRVAGDLLPGSGTAEQEPPGADFLWKRYLEIVQNPAEERGGWSVRSAGEGFAAELLRTNTEPYAAMEDRRLFLDSPFMAAKREKTLEHLALLEGYVKQASRLPPLVDAAIIILEIELLRPFGQLNGVAARLLGSEYLRWRSSSPLQTIPLGTNRAILGSRDAYSEALGGVLAEDDYEGWVAFFLGSVRASLDRIVVTISTLTNLFSECTNRLYTRKKQHSILLVQACENLFRWPVLSMQSLQKELAVSKQTASTLVRTLEDVGIIREATGFRRNQVFLFDEFLTILKGDRGGRTPQA